MFEKILDTGDGRVKVSTRFVGPQEQVLLTLSGKSGHYIVDSSALLTEAMVFELIETLQLAISSRRSTDSVEAK